MRIKLKGRLVNEHCSLHSLLLPLLTFALLFSASASSNETATTDYNNRMQACPNWLNETFRKLHSTEQINLCKAFAGKPLLIVNTASHCGFTYQFSGLESLHQRYKNKGLVVVGFASNDFRQAAKSEEKAATVCYINHGVTFTMVSSTLVTGTHAHPLFKALAQQTQAPKWNFTKFLVSANGKKVTRFDTMTAPNSPKLLSAIDAIL